MAETTAIEWCDSTFNPWIGCTRVSPACDDCYAARSTPARTLGVTWGPGAARRRTGKHNWGQPVAWQRQAESFRAEHGRRRRVFCASLADWLDNEVPIEWLVDLLELVRTTPDLNWLLLSKRIGNWSKRISEVFGYLDARTPAAYPLPLRAWLARWLENEDAPDNVWIMATVCGQDEFDRDIIKLLSVPATVHGLSVEPMLGPINMACEWLTAKLGAYPFPALPNEHRTKIADMLDWVICGGESGPKARPMRPEWARDLRDQCAASKVPFMLKQWGEWGPATDAAAVDRGEGIGGLLTESGSIVISANTVQRHGKKAAGRLLDGVEHNEFPKA